MGLQVQGELVVIHHGNLMMEALILTVVLEKVDGGKLQVLTHIEESRHHQVLHPVQLFKVVEVVEDGMVEVLDQVPVVVVVVVLHLLKEQLLLLMNQLKLV